MWDLCKGEEKEGVGGSGLEQLGRWGGWCEEVPDRLKWALRVYGREGDDDTMIVVVYNEHAYDLHVVLQVDAISE